MPFSLIPEPQLICLQLYPDEDVRFLYQYLQKKLFLMLVNSLNCIIKCSARSGKVNDYIEILISEFSNA